MDIENSFDGFAFLLNDYAELQFLFLQPGYICHGCFNITTVFSHSQTVVVCGNCPTVLCQPTGGRARLTEGCLFRKKGK
ncbi:40S ribosomal protein S27-B [Ranunculus cassubicifolius]